MHKLEELTPNSSQANDLLLFASRELQTDKIYYVLECYLNTEDQEEKFALQADLAGNFIPNAALKKIYRRIFGKPAKMMKAPFSKTKNTQDYFAIFAFSASYDEDVLEGRHELENLESIYPDDPDVVRSVITMIQRAPQLQPLTREEIRQVLARIQEFHGRAYGWTPSVSVDSLEKVADSSGYLLRTRLRAVIEMLDQLYQYGSFGTIRVNELGKETYEVDDTPALEDVE